MDLVLTSKICSRVEEFRRKQRTGILVLLFTDMVGSTKLKQDLGDDLAIRLIQEHHALLRGLLDQFKEAQEIDTAGDSFFIVFVKASDAVRYALLVQAGLRVLSARAGHTICDRIGIHAGEVTMEDREGSRKPMELFGIQVDTSARVMSLAEAGQTLMTRFVFDNSRQLLKGGEITGVGPLSWLSHGPYEMKGVEEPLDICEAGEIGAAPLRAPQDSEKAHRTITGEGDLVLGWRPALSQTVPRSEWVLERKLGEGGFGEVWLARHQKLKEQRVFKFCFRADRVRSLKREVTLFRLLRERVGTHPNIVGIQDVYFDEPPFFIVMDYAEGLDLVRWVELQKGCGNILLTVRLEIVARVAEALQAAHDAGIIHRDVKPSNIIISGSSLEDLRVKLTDFGIGQLVSKDLLAGVTQMGFTQTASGGSATGTPMYMAPELLAGKPASTRSDTYSLGVMLYQLLRGDLTHPVATDWGREIESGLLREDLARCLAGKPEERFSGPQELARQLRTLPERRLELSRREAELAAREKAAQQRGMMRVSALALGIVILVGWLAVWAMHQSSVARREAALAEAKAKEATTAKSQTLEALLKVRETLSAAEFLQGTRAVSEGDPSKALAYLARGMTENTSNHAAAFRLTTLLAFTPWPIPVRTLSKADGFKFSPDGKLIVLWSRGNGTNGLAEVLEAENGRLVANIIGRGEGFRSAQFSPDGSRILTVSEGGSAEIWSSLDGKSMVSSLAHAGLVNNAGFSPDGQRVVTASTDHTARVWSALNGQSVPWVLPHGTSAKSAPRAGNGKLEMILSEVLGGVNWAEFSPDGTRILTASGDGAARIWNADTGQMVTPPLEHDGNVLFGKFSPDGNVVATVWWDGSARLWNARTGQALGAPLPHADRVNYLEFSPDGGQLVSASEDHTARVWSVPAGVPVSAPMPHSERVLEAHFSPDGSKIITSSDDQTARVWDAQTGHPLTSPICSVGGVTSAQFTPDGRSIVTTCSTGAGQVLDLLNLISPLRQTLRPGGLVYSAAFSPDDRWIVTASADGKVLIWNAQTANLASELSTEGRITYSARFSPDGARILTTSADGAQLWSFPAGKPLTGRFGQEVRTARFSLDGHRILTSSKGGVEQQWDAQTGKMIPDVINLAVFEAQVEFSKDRKRVLKMAGSTVQICDSASGKPISPPLEHREVAISAEFSEDGQWVVTATANAARVWDSQTGQPVSPPLPQDSRISGAHFSRNGTRIVTESDDSVVWDLSPSTSQVPPWLPALAEAIAGETLNSQGVLEPIKGRGAELIDRIRQDLKRSANQDDWSCWGRWFLGDLNARTISPFYRRDLSGYVDDLIKEKNLDALDLTERQLLGQKALLSRIAQARESLARESDLMRSADTSINRSNLTELLSRQVDAVVPGNVTSEADHNFVSGATQSGIYQGRTWRSVFTSWFAYELKVLPGQKTSLVCNYSRSDSGPFLEVFVHDRLIPARELPVTTRSEGSIFLEYDISNEISLGSDHVVVKLQSPHSGFPRRLFGIQSLKPAGKAVHN